MKRILAMLMICVLTLTAFSAFAEETVPGNQYDLSQASQPERKKITRFILEPFAEGVTDEDSAIEAIDSVAEELGIDDSIQLLLNTTYSTEDLTFYVFLQTAGNIIVESGSVKLAVDNNGTAVFAASDLVAGLNPDQFQERELTEEEAESIVEKAVAQDGARVYRGMSHEAILEVGDEQQVVWVVYTNNPFKDLDVAYHACYVSQEGEFLGGVPVLAPYSSDEENASSTALVFQDMEPDVWSGEVTLFDGSVRSLVVPVVKDSDGIRYLADLDRKILCVDYSDWTYNDELNIRNDRDGKFDDGELLIYESMIRVWDFYNEVGWEGADGKGTPILLQMDMKDEEGNPIVNAYYSGKTRGYQTFSFNRVERDGETLDIIGHEFTHCVTSEMTINMPYLNDSGAINEAISDIMGNLMEEMLDASDDPTWLLGEAAKNPDQILRCMSDPHLYDQPEFVWDKDYMPSVKNGTEENDYGGVHSNSSLLNLIAWRLHEAGMEPENEFYFMMNVILTMNSSIEYPDLVDLLPWCLKQVKMDEYAEVLEAAIEETGIASIVPEYYVPGHALVNLAVPGEMPFLSSELNLSFIYLDENSEVLSLVALPDSRLEEIMMQLPEGRYIVGLDDLQNGRTWMLTDDGWTEITGIPSDQLPEFKYYSFASETFYELPMTGLLPAASGETAD